MKLLSFIISLVFGGITFVCHENLSLQTLANANPILLSILIGAILIRLARGLPPLKIETMDREKALKVIEAFEYLEKAYVSSFFILFFTLVYSIFYYSVLDKVDLNNLKAAMKCVLVFSTLMSLGEARALISLDLKIFQIQRKAMKGWIELEAENEAVKARENVKKAMTKKALPKIRK